ncbi:MAG: hypothetical protein H0Z35_10845 [Thermoanaerobacteraceae bacterium]|nr:hypothetical protein [Thermoanaerobacteraceae bacterium]
MDFTLLQSGIIINLKSGKRILILRSGQDFEVQRYDVRPKNISYWAKQQDIKEYLDKLATNTKDLSKIIDDNLYAIIHNLKAMSFLIPYNISRDLLYLNRINSFINVHGREIYLSLMGMRQYTLMVLKYIDCFSMADI